MKKTVRRTNTAPDVERKILNLIPVSVWIEDFSEVKRRIDHFRSAGVADLREHLDRRPQEALALIGMIRTVWVNDATLELYETADRSLFQGHLHHVFGKDSYEVLKDQIVALADGRTEFIRETVLTTPQGQRKNILLHAKLDPSCTRRLSRVFVAITDITSVKAAEERLKHSEALYRLAFESSAVPMMIIDALTEIIVDANRSLQQVLGLPLQEFQGAPLGQFCPDSHNARCTEALVNLISGRQPLIESLRLRCGDGAEIQVVATARAVRSGDHAFTVLAFSPPGSSAFSWERRTRVDRRAAAIVTEKLTARERQILTLITSGQTNTTIAERLGISRKTVETHRLNLMQKLDIHKATDLVRYALTSGLLQSK